MKETQRCNDPSAYQQVYLLVVFDIDIIVKPIDDFSYQPDDYESNAHRGFHFSHGRSFFDWSRFLVSLEKFVEERVGRGEEKEEEEEEEEEKEKENFCDSTNANESRTRRWSRKRFCLLTLLEKERDR
ncbi:hypothetical protein V1478_013311 [Vespula squamosa]|uniref:Uncharacterized protein n=1 Tax=Vespula squamosa TaxID=30214 RepID=A0ABD2AAG8_VESSQ